MYAIIAEDGRQYKVEEGQEFDIDYRDVSKGAEIRFENVLALGDDDGIQLGRPKLEGATVTAEVVGVNLGDKLIVQKFRRRKNSRRKTGHRQMFTKVKVQSINS
jgi:large subunit ribosomal protein L21